MSFVLLLNFVVLSNHFLVDSLFFFLDQFLLVSFVLLLNFVVLCNHFLVVCLNERHIEIALGIGFLHENLFNS